MQSATTVSSRGVLFVLAGMVVLAGFARAQDQIRWEFREARDLAAWEFQNVDTSLAHPRVTSGRLELGLGMDTFMVRHADIDLAAYPHVEIKLRVVPRDPAQESAVAAVYFSGGGGGITPDRVVSRTIPARVEYTLRLDMAENPAWRSPVRALRLDPDNLNEPGIAEVWSITLARAGHSTDRTAWDFSRPGDADGWEVGEYYQDPASGAGYKVRDKVFRDGALLVSNASGDPAMQVSVRIDAARTTRLFAELLYPHGNPTLANVYWTQGGDGYHQAHSAQAFVQPSAAWQTVRFDMAGMPGWQGTIRNIRFDPISDPGAVLVRRVWFEGPGAAAAVQAAAGTARPVAPPREVRWLSQYEVDAAVRARPNQPMLVFVEDPDVALCRTVMSELARDDEFIRLAAGAHCVRLRSDDPAVARTFADNPVFRVPTLILMTWDSRNGWTEHDRAIGPSVSERAKPMLRQWAGEDPYRLGG